MFHTCYIAAFSLLCLVARSEKCKTCKQLKDQTIDDSDLTVERVQRVAEDALNITEHLDEYVANLRETIKNENLPPDTVKYYFFTFENEKDPIDITATKDSFKNIPYNCEKPLAFGIHGFTKSAHLEDGMTGEIVKTIVELNKYNVIFVDYSMLTDDVLSAVVPKAYLAAKDMARFLQFLMDETGTEPEQIHVIGQSLGGQVAGMVGQFLPGLGRITGLDPGGKFFDFFPEDLRLDRSDAIFVDVIHAADAYPYPKGFGYYKPCGHLDFYPNGGLCQPGCNLTIPIEQTPTTKEEISERLCMHVRYAVYYIQSICCNCPFIGILCDSYENFQRGLCTPENSATAIMGEFATKPLIDLPEDAMFFLNTNGHYPICTF